MHIRIDYNSGEPILRQAIDQIKFMVVNGTLSPGDKLPSIRELAKMLKINPTTVSRIYTALEQEGIIVLRQGQGAFIASSQKGISLKAAKQTAARHAKTLLVEGLRAGLEFGQIQNIVEEEYKKIKCKK